MSMKSKELAADSFCTPTTSAGRPRLGLSRRSLTFRDIARAGLFKNRAVTHNVGNVGDIVHIGFEIEFKA